MGQLRGRLLEQTQCGWFDLALLTYLGESGIDTATSVAVDSAGNA
jgi:hypothetical protein